MLMRLVEAKLKSETLDEFGAIYRNKIISELEDTPVYCRILMRPIN